MEAAVKLSADVKALLELPRDYVTAALAIPDKVDKAIALLTDIQSAKDFLDKYDAYVDYLGKRLRGHTRAVNAAQYGRLKLVAHVGGLLPRGEKGRGKKNGRGPRPFSKDTLAAYRKVHDNAARIDEYRAKADQDAEVDMSTSGFVRFVNADGIIATKHGGGVVDWYTPAKYIVAAREVMGKIDLDPASNEFAQETVKAGRFFSIEDDGLRSDWRGNVFLNPPFKMPDGKAFVLRLCDFVESGAVAQAVLLTNNNTDTDWWQRAAKLCAAVCFTDGRIGFYNRAGEKSCPTNGQTFCYFGNRKKKFADRFAEFGIVLNAL